MLFLCIGWRKRKGVDHTLSYCDALAKTASESIQTIVRRRRILFTGFVVRIEKERLPQRVKLGRLLGVKATQGGKKKTG